MLLAITGGLRGVYLYIILLCIALGGSHAVQESGGVVVDLGPNAPNISPHTTRGMVIDAGSGGTRLHVFKWQERVFSTVPPPLSFPTSDEKWTGRMAPAIDTYVDDLEGIRMHLAPLIDFAKSVLGEDTSKYPGFPIYFKATGGMRELDQFNRERVLNKVRSLLSDKSFNPFYFQDDFARVISGEEEAIYSWCATNLLMGSLLQDSIGQGAVSLGNRTYGTVDLGGSSTQIAFFAPDQDILEGLFKLQIGAQKHWNVYAKSFLKFGINSARERFLTELANQYALSHPKDDISVRPIVLSYCFHAGYSEHVASEVFVNGRQYVVEITGPAVPAEDQFQRCFDSLKFLLFKSDSDSYCKTVYHGQCSLADSYQPPLPQGLHEHFIGTSSYTIPWKVLNLPTTSSLDLFRDKSVDICRLNFSELLKYYEDNNLSLLKDKVADLVPYFCFLSSYTLALLTEGYGFRWNTTLTVLDEVGGNKVTWTLGAILYEINTLPWGLKDGIEKTPWSLIILCCSVGFVAGVVIAYLLSRRNSTSYDKHTYYIIDHAVSGDSLNSAMTISRNNSLGNILSNLYHGSYQSTDELHNMQHSNSNSNSHIELSAQSMDAINDVLAKDEKSLVRKV